MSHSRVVTAKYKKSCPVHWFSPRNPSKYIVVFIGFGGLIVLGCKVPTNKPTILSQSVGPYTPEHTE